MENIRRWFENDQTNNGQNYEIDEYEGHLEARTDTVIFMVVEPHSGTKNRWMLRVSTRSLQLLRSSLIVILNYVIIYMNISWIFIKI